MASDLMKKCRKCFNDVKSVRWKEIVSGSFRFCVNPKAFIPLLIVNAFVLGISAQLGTFAVLSDTQALSYLTTADIVNMGILITAMLLFTLIVGPFVSGAVIHLSRSTGSYRESWKTSFSRLSSLVGASVAIITVMVLLSVIPVIGIFFTFIASIAFIFTMQVIIFGDRGFYSALRASASALSKKPGVVVAGWVTETVLSTIIYGIFMAPLMFLVSGLSAGALETLDYMGLASLGAPFYMAVFSLLFGASLKTSFELKFFTELYFQLKKKKWLAL